MRELPAGTREHDSKQETRLNNEATKQPSRGRCIGFELRKDLPAQAHAVTVGENQLHLADETMKMRNSFSFVAWLLCCQSRCGF
jgi:hypothetical protein